MLVNLNYDSKSPFLPPCSIPMFRTNIGVELTDELKNIALTEEQNIFNNTECAVDKDQTLLTARLWQYNLFDFNYPSIQILKEYIANQYQRYCGSIRAPTEKCYIHGWVNVLQPGQMITNHHHADAHCGAPRDTSYVSGNLSIQANATKTYYNNPFNPESSIGIDNEAGDMFLFPSFVVHSTDVNQDSEPRISLAFDIITESVYKSVNTTIFTQLN